jgi:DNA-binding CsgD family transcriptional regulator
VDRPAIVGRRAELQDLLVALSRAARGEGAIVLVEGEAGIGKTLLLEEALDSAHTLGFRRFTGAAEELERHRPFGAISECLGLGRRGRSMAGDRPPVPDAEEDERRAQVAGLLLGQGAAAGPALLPGAPEAEFRIVDALIDLVEHLCSHGPVVVAVEDLQWADPSTVLTLNRLGREISSLPAALIVTLRPLPRSSELEALLASLEARGATRLRLDRLGDGEVATLVATLLGARPGPGLLRQVARAGGNPFFAIELVASLQRVGAISVVNGVAEVAEVTLPSSLASTILHRLSFLSEEALETLQVASILGSSFSVADLAVVMGRSAPDLLDALGAATRGGILLNEGRSLTFRHDLIRQALYQRMPHAVRHALHLSAAHALVEAGLPPEEIAEHVLRGAAPGDLLAVEWLQAAARQIGSRSPTIAADLLQQALEIVLPGHPARDSMLADLALFLLSSDRLTESEAIARGVLARPHDPTVDGPLRLCLVQCCVGKGMVPGGLDEIDQAVRSPALTDRQRARLWGWAATCRVILWDLDGAVANAELALHACGKTDDLSAIIARAGLAAVENMRGNFAEALRLGEEAISLARQSRSPEARRLQLTLMHAVMLMDLDQLEDAQHALRRGRFARERRGSRWNLASYHFVSAIGRFLSGEWDEAIAQFNSAMDFAEEVTIRQGELVGHSVRSMIALHRGDLLTAGTEAMLAEADAFSSPQWRPDWMMWARALLLEAEGLEAEGLGMLTKAWELCSGAGVIAEFPVIGPDLVRMALRGREWILAEEVTGAVHSLAERVNVAGVTGAALRCRGLLGSDASLLLEAVAAYRRSSRPRELALACEDAAAALAASERDVEARPLVEECLEIYRSLDARRDTARAQARLARLAPRPRGERTRPRSGWESLTQTELSVAALVTEGLSNPEIARRLFISRRTVQCHVSHALDKLGLSSRVELAVVTADRQDGAKAGFGN